MSVRSKSVSLLCSRRGFASLAIAATALALSAFYAHTAYLAAAFLIPPLFLLSALLVHVSALGAQLAVRGLWWATALVGSALAVAWSGTASGEAGAVGALGASVALLALGFSAAVPQGKSVFFAPRAARATFTIALLVAACDALALGYFGILYFESFLVGGDLATGTETAMVLALAGAAGLFALGLFTLRVWAWLGAVGTTVLIGVLGFAGELPVPEVMGCVLGVLGVLATATQAPVLVQLLRGRGLQPSARGWAAVPVLVLVALSSLSVLALTGAA